MISTGLTQSLDRFNISSSSLSDVYYEVEYFINAIWIIFIDKMSEYIPRMFISLNVDHFILHIKVNGFFYTINHCWQLSVHAACSPGGC